MKQRNLFLIACLLMLAGVQTAWAQKMLIYKANKTTIELETSEVDSIVFIEAKAQLVTNIVLSQTRLTLQPNELKILTATVLPDNAKNKVVTWESNDNNVAEVNSNGRVIANAIGSCVITCRATDGSGVYAECNVTVRLDNSGSINGRDYVDLDLPSGTLWATCNVGANSPEECGDYFAWGETKPKNVYTWDTYEFCEGTEESLTKYCYDSSHGYYGFTDDLTELLPEDDAATANWGSDWQMMSDIQFKELINSKYTDVTWTTQNGVNGVKITSLSNGNSIFLPAAGYHERTIIGVGTVGYYWSRMLCMSDSGWHSSLANILFFASDFIRFYYPERYHGFPVRPVRKK